MKRVWLQVYQWSDTKEIEIHVTTDPSAGSAPLSAERNRTGGFHVMHTEEIDPISVANLLLDQIK